MVSRLVVISLKRAGGKSKFEEVLLWQKSIAKYEYLMVLIKYHLAILIDDISTANREEKFSTNVEYQYLNIYTI